MTKQEARTYYRKQRSILTESQTEKLKDLILIQFQQLHLPFVNLVHCFLPIHGKNEPDPDPLVRFLAFHNPGLGVAVPRVINDQDMVHILLREDTELVKNAFGILEPAEGVAVDPEEIDLVFVPLLAFDRSGNRVGYGKGYYDRFLASCREDVVRIGLSFFDALEKIEDTDPWDIPLDYCITPEQVYEF